MADTYDGVHAQIRNVRGKASGICSAPGCERPATQWALVGEPTHRGPMRPSRPVVVRWSTDVYAYEPTCRAHNAQLDHGGTWTHCPRGHERTSLYGPCAECGRENSRELAAARYAADPLPYLAANRAWRERNRGSLAQKNQEYRRKNAEAIKQQRREYYERNREAIKQKVRERRERVKSGSA